MDLLYVLGYVAVSFIISWSSYQRGRSTERAWWLSMVLSLEKQRDEGLSDEWAWRTMRDVAHGWRDQREP